MARLAGLLAVLVLLAACAGPDEATPARSDGRIEVVAGFYPVAEIARRVGGDLVRVRDLTPPGVEPHDVEITARQVDLIEDADLVLYLGGDFQPAVAEPARRRKDAAVDLLARIDVPPTPTKGERDPHFWLDPRLMAQAVTVVTEALVERVPSDAQGKLRANAAAYAAELRALDAEMAAGLKSCRRRVIVTAHAAFFALARRYGLVQLPIAGLSPESEPDADRLAELAGVIEENGITTVFYEELTSPDVARTLAREVGVTTAVLNPVEGLSRAQRRSGADYASVMRQNLVALRKALDCA